MDVQLDGKPPPPQLLWKRPLVLLLYLARSPRHSRTREHLVGLLWPDQPSKAAHHSLNEALRIVRRCGGAALIATQGDQIRLDPATLELDLDRFEQLARASQWVEASELVGGTFLDGFGVPDASGVEDWLTAERDTWSRKGVEALTRSAAGLLDAGRAAEAVRHAERAVQLDPLSDTAARALMRSLTLSGRRLEALQAYDAFAARIAAALHTKPDRDTDALAERLRRERGRRHTSRAAPERQPRRPPLIGRARELERLLAAWSGCHSGNRAAAALILGDAGTGKSRLAQEVAERAQLDGAAVASARAVEADLAEPWGGLLALADSALLQTPGVAAAPPAALGAFAARLSAWAERFPTAPQEGGPTLGRAFRDVVRAASSEQPCLLLIDDAHWCDRDSLLAVFATLRDLARCPCFLLLTANRHPPRAELDELRSRLPRDVRGASVTLQPLARDDLLLLSRWALPQYDAAALDRVTRRVGTDSAGLPLLAVELLSAVALGLELSTSTCAWPEPLKTLDQTLPGDLPDAVVGAVRVNYRRLSAVAQTVLAAAAVLGDRVSARRLARATGLAIDALHAALDELERESWLVAEPRGYGFVAHVLQAVVARDLVTRGQRDRYQQAAT